MSKDISDFLRTIHEIRAEAPWASPATDALLDAGTAFSHKSKTAPKRALVNNFLMLDSLRKIVEGAVRLYNEGAPSEQWKSEIDRVPAYARLIKDDILRIKDDVALTALSVEFAAIEARYGEAPVLDQDRLAVPKSANAMAEALDTRKSVLKKIDAAGVSYITGVTLAKMGRKDDDLSATYAELNQVRAATKGGGNIRFQNARSWFGLSTWESLGPLQSKVKDLKMREIGSGEKVILDSMRVYALGAYSTPKDAELDTPKERDASMLFVSSDEPIEITGPALISEWDENVLGPLERKRGFFGSVSPVFKGSKESMVLQSHLVIPRSESLSFRLLPVIMRSQIEKTPLIYDPHTPIAGHGENTIITYESCSGMDAARGRIIYEGVMPQSIRDLIFEKNGQGNANPSKIGMPCALAMSGSLTHGPVVHKILSVERTAQDVTTRAPLPELCSYIMRWKAAIQYHAAEAVEDITAPVFDRVKSASKIPSDSATILRAQGREERVIKVKGILSDEEATKIFAVLLAEDHEATVMMATSPDASMAFDDVATALDHLGHRYDEGAFMLEETEIPDFGY